MPEVEKQEKSRVTIVERTWDQPRIGIIDQVEMDDGRLKYNIQVTDVGRPTPFIDQYFSSEEAAIGLMDKVEMQSGGKKVDERELEADVTPRKPRSRTKLEDSTNGG